MVKKIKSFGLAMMAISFSALMVACGEPAAKEEPAQETVAPAEAPAEEPAAITLEDTTKIPVDSSAEQRPVNRR